MTEVPDCELKKDFGPETIDQFGSKFWMVRTCEWYWEEYKECSRWLGRIHQHFIFGHNIDCSDWLNDYNRCMNFRKTRDKDTFDRLLESEEKRINERLDQSRQNDIWQYRTKPPADWNRPIPQAPRMFKEASPLDMYEQKNRRQETI